LHGHNYKVEVEVRGDTMEASGFCLGLDFYQIDKLVKPLVDQLDHQLLNDFIENPTAENIASWFMKQLAQSYIFSITVWETDKCWATAVNPEGLYHAVHKE
jgi:6-pyruvoyltetrahydropterin/6-carboxytetrahydropterin synthase